MHARPQSKKRSVPELCPLSRFCDFTRHLGPVTVTFVPVFVTAGGATILEEKGEKKLLGCFCFLEEKVAYPGGLCWVLVGADHHRDPRNSGDCLMRWLTTTGKRKDAMRVTSLLMRRCCGCWIATGTPCYARSCGTLLPYWNSRQLMPWPWKGSLPTGKGTGANAANARRR